MMMKYELKKFFNKKINKMILIVMVFLAVVISYLAVGSMRYRDAEGKLYTGVTAGRRLAADRNKWKGKLTEEKIKEVVEDRRTLEQMYPEGIPDREYGKTVQSYDDIFSFGIYVFTPDSGYDQSVLYHWSDQQSESFYSMYETNILKMVQTYGKNLKQQEFLKRKYEEIEMPPDYAAKDSWDTMAMYAQTYGMILAVAIGFLASGIFADEFRTKAETVFFSAKYGRSKAIRNKILTGIAMTTVVYWAGMGILSGISLGIMGTSGFLTPYQIDQPYSIYIMTYGEYYFLILVCGYIASMFSATITMLATVKMHSANLANCVPFFLYCMMPFIGRAVPAFETVFNIMPGVFMNIIEYAKVPIVFQIGFVVVRQIPFVMIIYSILAIIWLLPVYKNFSKYGLRKS